MGNLRDTVAGSMAWSMAEKAGTVLLQIVVSFVVARRLAPEDYGVMAILTVFTAVALILVDSGFSQALIRGPEPSDNDCRAVFGFNMAMSVAAYAVLTLLSPLLARWYGEPMLARIAPVLLLLLPVNALGVVQNTLLTRRFRFDLISKIVFVSSLVSGIAAVTMAVAGCGVWSLVAQRVSQMAVKSALLWRFGGWRFGEGRREAVGRRRESLGRLAPFGVRILFTDLINTIYNNVASLFVGRMSVTTLGFFNQAQKMKDMPVLAITQSVQNVTFPALSAIGGDARKFAESYRKILMMMAFVMFPVMAGLAAVADDMFALLGRQWMPTVPYFKVLSLTGLFAPLASVALNVLKVGSDGGAVVRAEIVKKIFMTLALAVTIPMGVGALVWGLVASAAVDFAVNVTAASSYSQLGWGGVLRTLLPVAAVSAAMYAAVSAVLGLLPDGGADAVAMSALRIAAGVATGAAIYGGLSVMFRLEAAGEAREIFRNFCCGKDKR